MGSPIYAEDYEIRYYLGKYKVKAFECFKSRRLVVFLEKGRVGNKRIGYKYVKEGDIEFLYIRNLYKKRKE